MSKKRNQFSEYLNRLIVESGKSQSTVAKAVGINKPTLHNWCNGVKPQGLVGILKLADYFGVGYEELLTGKMAEKVTIQIKGECEGDFLISITKK